MDSNGETGASYASVKSNGIRKMYFATLVSLCFTIIAGMAIGYSASATADMKSDSSPIHPSDDDISWIGSTLALGVILGGIVAVFLSNIFGRKGSLLFSALPFLVGWLLVTYAENLISIYIGRLIIGFCVGIICVVTPAYLIEISTPEVRGLLGASFQLFVMLGVFIISAVGATLNWQWLNIPAATFLILATCLVCFIPESPRWLIEKGRPQEAAFAIEFLQNGNVDGKLECSRLQQDLKSQPGGAITFKDFKNPEVFLPALLSFALFFFQQFCGSNAVIFYTVDILKSTGTSLDPFIATIIVDAVLALATAVSCVLIDKAGRKPLLIISGICMGICLFPLGTHVYVCSTNLTFKSNYGWIPLVCIIGYVSGFSIGFGPIPPMMAAELTPLRYRGLICGAGTAICWLSAFTVTKTFQNLESSIHDYGTYFLYASFSILSSVFTYFCLPETKGRILEDIQKEFRNYFLKEMKSFSENYDNFP